MNSNHLKLFPLLLLLVISGCSTTSDSTRVEDRRTDAATESAMSEIELLLQQAETASPLVRAEYTLQAAEQLLEQQQTERAAGLLEPLNIAMLPVGSQQLYWLLKAEIASQQQRADQILQYLTQIQQPQLLSVQRQARLSALRVEGQTQVGDYSALLDQLIEDSPLQPEPQRQLTHNQIWSILSQKTPEALSELASQPDNSFLQQGWYDLALSLRGSGLDIIQGLQSVRNWQQLWSMHPAARNLPDNVAAIVEQHSDRPGHIAILLPQSGELASAGQTIIEGILAAHFEDQRLGLPAPRISFYDSTQIGNLFDFYFTATASGIDLVIGPLTKAEVSTLSDLPNVALPTLALNYADDTTPTLDLYQFGLSADDEAEQTAEYAWNQGYRRALSLSSSASWGVRTASAFEQAWLERGGILSDAKPFGDEGFSASISELLAIDQSEARYAHIRRYLGERSEFEPRRRQDADFLFLAALAKDARQLKPILAFHYASQLPVIATSHVYSGSPNSGKDQDLNGIRFTTTPWILQNDSSLRSSLETFRQNTQTRYGRLYALGADAYRLAPYLKQLQGAPGSFMAGNTGKLSIDQQGLVVRQLEWAQFENGLAQPTAR